MSQAQSERRTAPRADADLPLRLSASKADARPAELKNISRSGLCCSFPEPVDEMTVMGIDLALPGGPAHQVQGVVVRCEREEKQPRYEVAIYFTDMAADARRAITRFVDQELARQE
jgi:hypothetical protein